MRQTIANRLRRRYIAICLFILVGVLGLQLSTSTLVFAAEPTATLTPIPIFLTPTPAIHSDYWPTEDWRTSSPEDQQMDSQLLTQMLQAVTDNKINLHSLIVIRHGYIVSETYFPPYTIKRKHEVYSVTKSFTSTLVGIAIDRGFIDSLDHPVLDFFPDKTFENVDARKKAMTLRDLVTMQSGLDWNEEKEMGINTSDDWVAYTLNTPMRAEPGTESYYCTGCAHVVSAIIQKATKTTKRDFADKVLFKPLGISDILWKVDPDGIPSGGTGLRLEPRDMAKLGYLFLHNGEWDGQTIVSADWVKNATTTQAGANVDMATGVKLDYGYMWWTFPRLKAYLALGFDGQLIFNIPDLDLEVVMNASTGTRIYQDTFGLIEKYIVPAVKDMPADFLTASS
ncbi:MAG: serine hydrolase [Anaerolineae bacterium]|nr:serine hydrolase [Anaerolineae bacterium]